MFELLPAGPRTATEKVTPLQDLFACPIELVEQFGISGAIGSRLRRTLLGVISPLSATKIDRDSTFVFSFYLEILVGNDLNRCTIHGAPFVPNTRVT